MSRLALLLALLSACTTCGRPQTTLAPAPIDAGPRRPVSPPGKVHAYPPHAIAADRVGPYLLGEPMYQVLRELPEGPALELIQVGHYVNWRVARAESGAIVIGAAGSEVTFISVLRSDVARTAGGVAVGSPGAELRPADRAVIRDRLILELPALPGVSFLTDAPVDAAPADARITGVVVAPVDKAAEPEPPACAELSATPAEIVTAARLRLPATAPMVRRGCVTGASGEAFVVGEGELALVGGEPGKLRRLAVAPIGTVDFAGALDLDGDRRDEIVVGAQRRSPREHAVEVHVLRWDAGKLVEVLSERPFAISDGAAAAAGVTPEQIDLAVEIRAGRGSLQVGGFYTVRRDGVLRELTPLAPVTLRVEPRRPGGGPAAAATPDAATAAPDAGVH